MIEVACVFCGGCNPHYDRVALAERLAAACPQVHLVQMDRLTRSPAAILGICGCPAGCVRAPESASPPFFRITGEDGFSAAAEFLSALAGSSPFRRPE
jgi:hypothetical protein